MKNSINESEKVFQKKIEKWSWNARIRDSTTQKFISYFKTSVFNSINSQSYSSYWILRIIKKFFRHPETKKCLIIENKNRLASVFSRVTFKLEDNGAMSTKLQRKRNLIPKYCIQARFNSRIKTTNRYFQLWKNKKMIACISFHEGVNNDSVMESSQSRNE